MRVSFFETALPAISSAARVVLPNLRPQSTTRKRCRSRTISVCAGLRTTEVVLGEYFGREVKRSAVFTSHLMALSRLSECAIEHRVDGLVARLFRGDEVVLLFVAFVVA